jgi:hypothetical protein
MKGFKVGCSPITSDIYAGNVNDKGMWVGKKHNVTDTAVGAVAQHLLQLNEEMKFGYKGKEYVLQVVELKQQGQ